MRICAPEEELCTATVSVSMAIDRFFWHLQTCLSPLAHDRNFFVTDCDVKDDSHKSTSGAKTLQLLGKMGQLTAQWRNNMCAVMSVLEAQIGFEGAMLFAEADTLAHGLNDELDEVTKKAIEEKPVLQEAMRSLHTECCAVKVTFAKSNIAWVKIAVALPNRGKNRRPPVRKLRRPYPNM